MTKRVLFVCLGNICRSPLAEGMARRMASDRGMDEYQFDSAGTGGWHIGFPPDARAIVAGRAHGIDISKQRARLLRPDDFELFDRIVVMDQTIREDAEDHRPTGNTTPLERLASFGSSERLEIPDPYYSGKFDPVIALLEDCLAGYFDHLQATDPQ